MSVQSLRNHDLRLTPLPGTTPEPRVAVMLNANARRVNERIIRAVSHVVPEEDLFVSRSQLDARKIAQTVVERRYHTVFCGGGDGTFAGFVNEVHNQLDQRSRYLPAKAPKFAILKLGTGNGLASLVHASPVRGEGILDDVLRVRAGEVPGYRRLDMLSIDGKRAHFAGLGVDGKLLNDYLWVKQNFSKGTLTRWVSGGAAYFSSVAFKTIPYYLTHSTFVECEVINGPSAPAFLLGPDAGSVREYQPGEALFRGRLMMASAATIPFYGFNFRMFPFAGQRRGAMQLRLGALPTPTILANLPKLWQGRWFPEGIKDFSAEQVTIRFARPMPLQIAGDAEGYREEMTISMAPDPVELVDFTGLVH